jgi:hypothetical protein
MKKRHLIFFSFLFLPFLLPAQSRKYSFLYDEAGNCIQKYYTVVVQQAPSNTNNSPDNLELVSQIDLVDKQDLAPQIDEIGDVKISVFPNPTTGILNINSTSSSNGNFIEQSYQLVFLDLNGKVLLTKQISNADTQLDISAYPSGTYLLCIRFAGKQSAWRIIKL